MTERFVVAERFVAGPVRELPCAGLVVAIDLGTLAGSTRRLALERLVAAVPELTSRPAFRDRPDLFGATIALGDALARALGLRGPPARIDSPNAGTDTRQRAFFPLPRASLGGALVRGLDQLLAAALEGARGVVDVLDRVLEALIKTWEDPPESALLASAALARGIPVSWADGTGWLVLGQGRHRRVYHHFLFDGESDLREIAADKLSAARLLESAGIATARPIEIVSEDDAASLAARVGFPVVIKPSRAWAQIGVCPGITSEGAARSAFHHARTSAGPLGGGLVIEAHRPGRYVRATLVGGELAAAATSVAPEVLGDGVRDLTALTRESLALEPDEELDPRSLGILAACLAAQGLTRDHVPAPGRVVRVGFDNHGAMEDVTRSLHRTTRRLLAQVGRLFPSAILGVDLLMQDAAAPFDSRRDTVLEVNPAAGWALHSSTPEGARDLAPAILAHVRPDRVPVVAGVPGTGRALEALASDLAKRGVTSAGFTRERAWSGTKGGLLGVGVEAAALPCLDPRASVLLFEVDEALAARGLPFDRIDFLLVSKDRRSASGATGWLAAWLGSLHPTQAPPAPTTTRVARMVGAAREARPARR